MVKVNGDGGTPAFADFYMEARSRLLPWLRRCAGPAADDVFHDALLDAFQRWPEVAALDQPLSWVRTVAKRMVWRRCEREARRPRLEAMAEMPIGNDAGDQDVVDHDLLDALAQLKPEHAAAFRLTQLDDLDTASAADMLGVPVATVRVWVHRTRKQLAERTAGLTGRWVSEHRFTPADLERGMVARGYGRYVEAAMVCIVDRPVRWELRIGDGAYWSGTDDGERMDFGEASLGRGRLAISPIAAFEYHDGVKVPIPLGSNIGLSHHRLSIDADCLRLSLLKTETNPTNGVPDEVFLHASFDDVVYRWTGPPPSK